MKNPSFLNNSKLKFVESKKLFQSSDFESPKSPSIIKLDSGKLILLFSCKFLPIDSENSTVMISESENFGKSEKYREIWENLKILEIWENLGKFG